MDYAMIRHVLESILNPYFIGFSLFATLLACLCLLGDSRALRVGFFVVLIGFLLLSTRMIPSAMIRYWSSQYPVVTQANPAVHWVVVLGGGQRKGVNAPANHLLSIASIKRMVEGVRLYRQLPSATLLLSGGGDRDAQKTEAGHLGALAAWFGIPAEHVVLETQSINTADEAIAIKRWVQQTPFYLVTSSLHMPRAMALCEKQGLKPIAAPSDYPYDSAIDWPRDWLPHPIHFVSANLAWHELLGWAWGRIRGRI
ncbi:MAG TPA: hypothetical protein DDY37_04020 [Legionella sp.]|nr:hypothetical protein [Legionella sp.]